jgi:hypothetical protein
MKSNGSLLVIAALAAGSLGAMGCKSNDNKATDKVTDTGNNAAPAADTKAATPEDNPDSAPVVEESADTHDTPAGIERDARFVTYWAPHGPPALRVEERGVGPAGHFWRGGYYGWSGREYNWYPGRWYAPRAGYSYYGPSWHTYGGRWGYRPGRWYRR